MGEGRDEGAECSRGEAKAAGRCCRNAAGTRAGDLNGKE